LSPHIAAITYCKQTFKIILIVILIFVNNLFVYGAEKFREPITPVIPFNNLNKDKVSLGKKLFHDPKLSSDGTVSCAKCHNLETNGVDLLPVSFGINGEKGNRNSPTIINAALQYRFFWDGRAKTAEEQITDPIENPIEMGSSWQHILLYLGSNNEYISSFNQVYGVNPDRNLVIDAIAEFQKSLISYNSPFDQYLKGDENAISPEAKEGYALFKSYGCSQCHQGMNVGGNMFEKIGVIRPYYGKDNPAKLTDLGRYNLTGNKEDMYEFRVPSLRLVVKTPPYFHDGSISTLNEAIQLMGKHQLGRDIKDDHVNKIIQFLATLEGQLESGK